MSLLAMVSAKNMLRTKASVNAKTTVTMSAYAVVHETSKDRTSAPKYLDESAHKSAVKGKPDNEAILIAQSRWKGIFCLLLLPRWQLYPVSSPGKNPRPRTGAISRRNMTAVSIRGTRTSTRATPKKSSTAGLRRQLSNSQQAPTALEWPALSLEHPQFFQLLYGVFLQDVCRFVRRAARSWDGFDDEFMHNPMS